MIKVTNSGKIVKIVGQSDYFKQIVLNKNITLKPKENFFIRPNITIECDSDLDECWIHSNRIADYETQEMLPNSELVGILTYRITKEDGVYSLDIDGGYVGEEEFLLPKGTIIADIYYSVKNVISADVKELSYKTLYNENGILIKAQDEYKENFEIVINPDNTSYIKVNLPS